MAELVQERYAKTLFEVGKELNKEDIFMEELSLIKELVKENPDFIKLLSAQNIGAEELKNTTEKIFYGKISQEIINFLKILIDNRRFNLILEMIEFYKNYYYEDRNILEVTAITAVDMTDNQKTALSDKIKKLTDKEPIILNTVDKSIMGGVILKVNNSQIDNSIKGKLEDLKVKLSMIKM